MPALIRAPVRFDQTRHIAVDMPGHGASDLAPDGAGLADYVAAMAGLIDALRLAPVPVVGRSMGALFLTGVSDPNSTPAMSARMAREAPHGRTVALPGARHMMHLTHAAEISNTIAAFLDAARAAR